MFKHHKLILAIASSTLLSQSFASGVPNVDAANLAQNLANHLKTIEKMTQQYSKLQEQLVTQTKALEAQTGVKDIINLYDQGAKSYQAMSTIYAQFSNPQDLFSKGVDGLKGNAKKMIENLGVRERCQKQYVRSTQQKFCEGEVINKIAQITIQEEFVKNIDASIKDMQNIGKKMATATDIKQATDLNNQLKVSTAQLKAQQMIFNTQQQRSKQMANYAMRVNSQNFTAQLGNIRNDGQGTEWLGGAYDSYEDMADGASDSSTNSKKSQRAAEIATNRAYSKSTGYCARSVREALNMAGVPLQGANAKDLPPNLRKVGFKAVSINPSQAKKGDVIIYQAVPGHPYGHAAIYNGSQWVSDFKQNTPHAGAYRNGSYTVYRHA